jgi:general L-amino acid transport system substrate-binding protein
MSPKLLSLAAGALAVVLAAGPALAARLDDVKARGFVKCGVSQNAPGFSAIGADNEWAGFDVDFCRAVAAAIFNDPKAVRFTPTTNADGWTTLSAGAIDILAHSGTWTMNNDTARGARFVGVSFYDGQAFIVPKASGIDSALKLSGVPLCVEQGTTSELNASDYFAANDLDYKPVSLGSPEESLKAFLDGTCQAYTANSSALAAARSQFPNPADYVILPEIVAKKPLGPAVATGDDGWFAINRWVYFALLDAEELGVTQANVDEMVGSDSPEIKRLLGVEDDFGTPIGLTKDWAYQVIKGVGNYGEIFARNVGPQTPLQLQPGLNALWKDGGLQYAPPIR